CRRRTHADCGLELLRHPHERAQPEDADEDDVVHQNGADDDKDVAGHDPRTERNEVIIPRRQWGLNPDELIGLSAYLVRCTQAATRARAANVHRQSGGGGARLAVCTPHWPLRRSAKKWRRLIAIERKAICSHGISSSVNNPTSSDSSPARKSRS